MYIDQIYEIHIRIEELKNKLAEVVKMMILYVANTMKSFIDFIVYISEKLTCNNWRKTHGLPLIRKRKKR